LHYQRLAAALSGCALLAFSAAARAQEIGVAEPVSGEAAAAPASCCTVPARTVVEIEILDALNSRDSHSRDSFALRLAEPLVVEGRTVAPAGTPGVGEVVHAARARAGGKAGELILTARYLDLNGTRVPLRSLRYGPSQGRDNSGAVNTGAMVAAAVLPVAALAGHLIAGGEVRISSGTRAHAQTAADVVLAPGE
jgi:hypothetical protein